MEGELASGPLGRGGRIVPRSPAPLPTDVAPPGAAQPFQMTPLFLSPDTAMGLSWVEPPLCPVESSMAVGRYSQVRPAWMDLGCMETEGVVFFWKWRLRPAPACYGGEEWGSVLRGLHACGFEALTPRAPPPPSGAPHGRDAPFPPPQGLSGDDGPSSCIIPVRPPGDFCRACEGSLSRDSDLGARAGCRR